MVKVGRRVGGAFVDYPLLTNVVLIALVCLHAFLTRLAPWIDVASLLAEGADSADSLSELALGSATIAAMVGGFAGVVVIFGLGAEYDRFRILRQHGGRRLRASWISVVLVSFGSAFGSVIASVTTLAFDPIIGMWIFEGALLLSAHGAIRLTWLLARLATLVDAADDAESQRKQIVPLSEIFPGG